MLVGGCGCGESESGSSGREGVLSASASIALGAAVTHPPVDVRGLTTLCMYMSPPSSTTVIHGKYLGDACRRETRETWRPSFRAMASRIMPMVFRSSWNSLWLQDFGAGCRGWMDAAGRDEKARDRTEVMPCRHVETRQGEREKEKTGSPHGYPIRTHPKPSSGVENSFRGTVQYRIGTYHTACPGGR